MRWRLGLGFANATGFNFHSLVVSNSKSFRITTCCNHLHLFEVASRMLKMSELAVFNNPRDRMSYVEA